MSEEENKEEGEIVTASEQPEIVLADLMDEEKKQELISRLETIKGVLDRVEGSIEAGLDDTSDPDGDEEVKVFSPELAEMTVRLLVGINSDVRENLRVISELAPTQSRDDMLKKGLEIIDKSGTIYKEIQDSVR